MDEANQLAVGPMEVFQRADVAHRVQIGALDRLPAELLRVGRVRHCWAFRRLGVTLDATTGAMCQMDSSRGDRPPSGAHAGSGR